jgi:hypothetical protein
VDGRAKPGHDVERSVVHLPERDEMNLNRLLN